MPNGYGQFWSGERGTGAHRFSYVLANGAVPAGMNVLHHCDNPPCVRPDHLYVGTQVENTGDALARGRYVDNSANLLGQTGERNPRSKLTAEAVADIRSSPLSALALAQKYGVTRSNVYGIRARKTWKGD